MRRKDYANSCMSHKLKLSCVVPFLVRRMHSKSRIYLTHSSLRAADFIVLISETTHVGSLAFKPLIVSSSKRFLSIRN